MSFYFCIPSYIMRFFLVSLGYLIHPIYYTYLVCTIRVALVQLVSVVIIVFSYPTVSAMVSLN